MSDDLKRVAEVVPEPVLTVCRVLRGAGHEAWAVGGAVRDAILGRPIGDWDVATSAHPDEVQQLFDRTIPTGIQHGTVTVVIGRGDRRQAIEVTTFRGDGEYTDARRPDSVQFGVPLDDDLARRDLVINAMAFDPVDGVLHDPFGGRDDIEARRIRAVGTAEDRFLEDGLRVMRAIRFAAQLEFELDPETERAIGVALSSLARVAVERVREELHKMLKARRPSIGLELARRTGIFGIVLPELRLDDDNFGRLCRRVDAARDVPVREASLLVGSADAGEVDAIMRRLKTSNDERQEVVRLVTYARMWAREIADPELRRTLGEIGRDNLPRLLELWRADAATEGRAEDGEAFAARVRGIVDAGDPLTVGELAIRGADLIDLLSTRPGRHLGDILRQLLDEVLIDPSLNQRDRLAPLAVELYRARSDDDRAGS